MGKYHDRKKKEEVERLLKPKDKLLKKLERLAEKAKKKRTFVNK